MIDALFRVSIPVSILCMFLAVAYRGRTVAAVGAVLGAIFAIPVPLYMMGSTLWFFQLLAAGVIFAALATAVLVFRSSNTAKWGLLAQVLLTGSMFLILHLRTVS